MSILGKFTLAVFWFFLPGVGRILAYNINSQAHLIEQEQKRLFADCTDIQADIQREIQERKAQFDVKVSYVLVIIVHSHWGLNDYVSVIYAKTS